MARGTTKPWGMRVARCPFYQYFSFRIHEKLPYFLTMTQRPVDYTALRHLITLQCQRRISAHSPWSWMDLVVTGSDTETSTTEPPCPIGCMHIDCSRRWSKYPQSLFPDWTPSHVEKSGIAKALTSRPCEKGTELACVIRGIDLHSTSSDKPIDDNYDRNFIYKRNPRIQVAIVFEKSKEHVVTEENKDEFYSEIQGKRSTNIYVRALFIENLSGPILQMLGTKYHINPLFYSSLLNWVPSRCRETLPGQGEHMTVIFPFVCVMQEYSKVNPKSQLRLSPDITLVVDLLAIHVVVNQTGSTILSFSPSHDYLRCRIWDARQSSNWQNLHRTSGYPRLFLNLYLWYVLYAWDEALEILYSHISMMELEAQEHGGVELIEKLHLIRCHLLSYSSILQEFRASVRFVDAYAVADLQWDEEGRAIREPSLDWGTEGSQHLLAEIDKLEKRITEPSAKLENLIRLTESQRMQTLTEATIRDNAATGLTAYLTLIILPAAFVSGVFLGMRGSVAQYFGIVIPLIVFTIWVVETFQTKRSLNNPRVKKHWSGFGSPFLVFRKWFSMERPRR